MPPRVGGGAPSRCAAPSCGPTRDAATRQDARSPLLGGAPGASRSRQIGSRRLGGLGKVGRSGENAPRGDVSLVILHLFLVPAKLLLDLVYALIHRRLRG